MNSERQPIWSTSLAFGVSAVLLVSGEIAPASAAVTDAVVGQNKNAIVMPGENAFRVQETRTPVSPTQLNNLRGSIGERQVPQPLARREKIVFSDAHIHYIRKTPDLRRNNQIAPPVFTRDSKLPSQKGEFKVAAKARRTPRDGHGNIFR